MGKIFVDTGGWVALFLKSDTHHKKATSIFNHLKASNAHLYTSDYVIDETITAILSRSDHSQSVFAGEVLFTSELIKIVYIAPEYLQPAWELYQKYKDKRFSFTDVSCFSVMKSLHIQKAFSFDREFVQAGIELIS